MEVESFLPFAERLSTVVWGREPAPGDTDERFCGSYKLFRPDGTFMPHPECPMAQVVTGAVLEIRDAGDYRAA